MLISLGDRLRNVLPEDADSWLIDTIKDKIQGGSGEEQPAGDQSRAPATDARPAAYDTTERNGLDQLLQSSNAQ